MKILDRIKDFIIKSLGGYRIIVGCFNEVDGSFNSSNVTLYPFNKHCMRFRRYTLFFDKEGKVTIKENK